MDVAPRVDQLLAKAVDEQLSEQRLIREALENLEERLEQVEASTVALEEKINPWSDPGAATADLAVRVEKRFTKRLGVLQARIDDMADAVEERAVEAISADVAAVADELRKAVSELARLLVRDRGRITNILTEHRNAILAELRLPAETSRIGHRLDLRDAPVDLNFNVGEVDDDVAAEAGGAPAKPRLRRLRGL